jgi:hypothetical protein
MPVIVPDTEYARWLDCSNPDDVADLLGAWSGEPLHAYPVSTRVNAVRNDDAGLCEPIDVSIAATATDPAEPELAVGIDDPPDEEEAPVQASLF